MSDNRIVLNGQEQQVIVCGTCGVTHTVPLVVYLNALEEGGWWHCPSGHQRGFREGRKEKEALRRERDKLKQEAARLEEEAASALRERDLAERRAAAAKKQLTKLHKRVGNGHCPCCNRGFVNLQRHMAAKHPDFKNNVVEFKAEAS